ncbi:PREDICTED: ES1 protein homolog, mitochondrial [Crocodylus porosus]|uniref:ES1 protein homolog, mitochondrial n=1 Tax=Crocodylus porosus TaxID=8502 RepID=UPI00093EB797|nr:PREDICTED: ES1 protein homolog, mitochondrial [Crocodylus porosus]
MAVAFASSCNRVKTVAVELQNTGKRNSNCNRYQEELLGSLGKEGLFYERRLKGIARLNSKMMAGSKYDCLVELHQEINTRKGEELCKPKGKIGSRTNSYKLAESKFRLKIKFSKYQTIYFLLQVLSGCGVYDGTEIHEASAILFHLSRKGAEVQMYAPDILQMHVIDHTKGQPVEAESRNVLTESARIARGKITNLAKLTTQDHDAVIFPGGFGAAKNLSTFAVDGKDCKVHKEVERVLQEFHKAGKPIGLCCISPVLVAKVLPGAEVTVGHEVEEGGKWPYAGTAGAIKALGAKHCVKEVTEAHVDLKNKVVTTPAFMCETELHHIFEGIGAMVKNVLKLTGKYSGVS